MSSKSRFIPQRWKSWQTVWTWPTKLRGGTGSARRVIFQMHALKSACTSFYRGLHNAYIPNTVKHQSLNRTVSYIFWRQNCHDKRKKEILVFLVPEGYFLNLYQQWSPVTWPPHQGLSLPCPQPSTPPISSSLGSAAPAPGMQQHCQSPVPTSPSAPQLPCSLLEVAWDRLQNPALLHWGVPTTPGPHPRGPLFLLCPHTQVYYCSHKTDQITQSVFKKKTPGICDTWCCPAS